jgi:hypothetical protein
MKEFGEMGCAYISEVLKDLVGPEGYSTVDLVETGSSFEKLSGDNNCNVCELTPDGTSEMPGKPPLGSG